MTYRERGFQRVDMLPDSAMTQTQFLQFRITTPQSKLLFYYKFTSDITILSYTKGG